MAQIRGPKRGTGALASFKLILLLLLSAAALGLGGCADYLADRELEKVAKGWCKTIRASQVIPVYPLTEDLRPGDVFLVRRPIADQAKDWHDKGYLVLDDARVRLGYDQHQASPNALPNVYQRMYFDGYWKDGFGKNPNDRITVASPGQIKKPSDGTPGDAAQAIFSQANAPRAAFPTYSFQVKQGSALGAAVPIQGIPVAMSFMQSGSVDGSVTIADAYTYAGDPYTLYRQAIEWANSGEQPEILNDAAIQQQKGTSREPIYLRVVTRVYMTGAMAVSLTNAESVGANLKGGAGPDAKILNDDSGDFTERYKNLLDNLSSRANATPAVDAAGKLIPGASVQFAWATQRSVALNEKFPTPLVVGYLGFDIPIFAENGKAPRFGYPLPTWGLLNDQVRIPSEGEHFKPTTRAAVIALTKGSARRRFRCFEMAGHPRQRDRDLHRRSGRQGRFPTAAIPLHEVRLPVQLLHLASRASSNFRPDFRQRLPRARPLSHTQEPDHGKDTQARGLLVRRPDGESPQGRVRQHRREHGLPRSARPRYRLAHPRLMGRCPGRSHHPRPCRQGLRPCRVGLQWRALGPSARSRPVHPRGASLKNRS